MKQDNYTNNKSQDHLLEMYKLYVEMTDRISQRRLDTNRWFLAINTALLMAIGYFLPSNRPYEFVLACLAGIISCCLWVVLIKSYKKMNKIRFSIIHKIEKFLPENMYTQEYKILKENKFKPFTYIEIWVPVLFGFLFLLMIVFYAI